MKENFFQRIENPNKFRREILESSKLVIENLKTQQKINNIRVKKAERQKEIKVLFKEITLLINKIEEFFPSEKISVELEGDKKKQAKDKKKNAKKKEEKKVEISELTKLENKLEEIESKLKTLG